MFSLKKIEIFIPWKVHRDNDIILMDKLYIYYICVLKKCLTEICGIHYPREIIMLIIMADYKHIQIACGNNHTILINENKYSWGSNRYGQLGLGDNVNRYNPTKFSLPQDIKSIVCCNDSIILTNNKLYICGWNIHEKTPPSTRYVPQQISNIEYGISDIKTINGGNNCTFILLKSGKCYMWGMNYYGQLGLGISDFKKIELPIELPLSNIVSISCKKHHVFALTTSNECYGWGKNKYGQLGLGDEYDGDGLSPRKLELMHIISIHCGGYHTIALRQESCFGTTLYSWGRNNLGQLGLGHTIDKNLPQKIMLENVVSVNCGEYHTMVLIAGFEIFVWGNNKMGQLGIGDNNNCTSIPTKLNFNFNGFVVSIYCGNNHNIVVTNTNKIYVWGGNFLGQLGLSDTVDRSSPTELIF